MGAAKKKGLSLGCVTLFLSVFVVAFSGFGGWGVYQQLRVDDFLAVDGVVTFSEVGESRGDDGTTYFPDIRFRYTVDGQKHDSGTYRIQQLSSSGRRGKLEIVGRHPVGAKVQGWYDPGKPETAVIDKSFSFFPVIFLGVGILVLAIIIGIWVWHFRGGGSQAEQLEGLERGPRDHGVTLQTFRGGAGQVTSFRGTVVFCIVWNTFCWIFAAIFWFAGVDEDMPWFVWLVIGLFLVIGLVLIVSTIAMAMARMKLSPPELSISVHPLRLGESFEVEFRQLAKRPVHIEQVVVKLVCRESATYTRGTDTTTDSHDVHENEQETSQDIQADSAHPIQGTLEFQIPADGMHTFEAPRNRIDWLLEVHTAIADWPDYKETFELTVEPERVQET